MGYRSFSNDELHQVIADWMKDPPPPGSRGEQAYREARAELNRRMGDALPRAGIRSSTRTQRRTLLLGSADGARTGTVENER
jgi:hypothetical protein